MKSKLWVFSLGFVLFFVPLGRLVSAQSGIVEQTAQVRTEITKRIENGKNKVKLRLRSGEEMKGRLEVANATDFTLTEDKGKQPITVNYADVERVEGRGGLSKGAKIGIIAGIAVTVVAVAAYVSLRNFDPFKGGILVR